MRLSIYVILATFIGPLFPVGAVMVDHPVAGAVAPYVVVKAGYRSFSGIVQTMSEDRIRLRDHKLGDIPVVITQETSISKNGHGTTSQAIRAGTRLHGYGSFRGGNYYAKVITID